VIIDAYNNVWKPSGTSDYLTSEDYGVEQLLHSMDAAGVDMAVACSLGQAIDNRYISSLAKAWPKRVIGFGQVNPRAGDAIDSIHECAEALGLRGLKLHPTMHGYHFADHGLLDPVFRSCQEAGLVILVNALDDPFCSPLAVEEIARGFPDVPVVLAHMGTVWNVVEAILVAGRSPNIFLDTSGTQLIEVRMAYDKLGPRKLLMGTDWPGSDFDLELLKLAKVIDDEGDRRLVEGDNLARLLRISMNLDHG
jgi:predicted TIM-barrel fold metal-dependent hydrolase